ncbi:MAG: ribonuclease H-like domain-containing protein [Candidatus Eisenbacteria bacterium]
MLEESIRQRIENLRLVLRERTSREFTADTSHEPLSVEDLEDASEVTCCKGGCLLIEKQVDRYLSSEALEGAAEILLEGDGSAPSFIFLDLETTGFSATPLFLAGTLFIKDGHVMLMQFLARDYSEEGAIIAMLDELLTGFNFCVTFNGKSFDVPYVRERAKYHKIELKAAPRQFDLLHPARRMWKHSLPNCRLVTLEWHILGRRRIGDVPGWEVPCIYHDFVHTKDARKLRDVLRHNLIDVVSMAELFVNLAGAATC